MNEDDGHVVGSIAPGPDTASPPLFKVIPSGMEKYDKDVCQHSAFKLSEKWSAVTCGHCGERLDPFAVLMQYAAWWQTFDNRRMEAESAEKRMHEANLRRLKRLRYVTDEEREEIAAALDDWPHPRLGELREMSRRIEKEYDRRRAQR